MTDEFDIRNIVKRFEETVLPGDDAAAQLFFENEFPHFSEDVRQAFLREALVSAIESAAVELHEEQGKGK
jgi:hypothetical protein